MFYFGSNQLHFTPEFFGQARKQNRHLEKRNSCSLSLPSPFPLLSSSSRTSPQIQLAGAIASLLGVWLYHLCLKKVAPRQVFFWGTLAGAALGMTQLVLVSGLNRHLGLSDQLFALGDDVGE